MVVYTHGTRVAGLQTFCLSKYKQVLFFFCVCPLSWRTKVRSLKKQKKTRKEQRKDDQSQNDAFELLWEGKIRLSASCRWTLQKTFPACSALPIEHCFTSSSVLYTTTYYSYLNRNLHVGVMGCQNYSY